MIIADNIITISVLGRKILSTSFRNINIKLFHICYGRCYGQHMRPGLQIKFDDYVHHNCMIEIDRAMENNLEWKSNFKTKNGTYHSTAIKIDKDKFIELAEALNIKDNLLAVVVNNFLGQLDVVQKPLVGMMEGHPLFSGKALLGNGQIIMSIDPIGLLGISQKLKENIDVA